MIAAAITALTLAGLPASEFRATRPLPASVATGAVGFEPDGAMLGGAGTDLASLRIADADGNQVPWRFVPDARRRVGREARVLNAGTRDGQAVALLDTGSPRRIYERVALEIDGSDFVGTVTAYGADRRGGPFTRLSATTVYDLRGASSARSTTIVLPETDARYLELRGRGVGAITAATVLGSEERPKLVVRRPAATSPARTAGGRTTVTLDLGAAGTPVTMAELDARLPQRYDRPVTIEGADDRRYFTPIASGTMRRSGSSLRPQIELESEYRFLRFTVDNGDDPALTALSIRVLGPSRAVMVEGGRRPPLTAYYGAPVGPPSYEFARLPVTAPVSTLPPSALGVEQIQPGEVAERPWGERNRWVVQAAIALAAVAVGAVGVMAVRRSA
ncbi:MAG: hypothetical protein V9E83_00065 [Baekduia sp.]